jgi:hypothetical protein
MLSYCTQTVNASVEVKKPGGYTAGDERLSAGPGDTARTRGWKEEEVLVRLVFKRRLSDSDVQANQLANEESVEAIVRKRTLDGKRFATERRWS